MLRWPALENTRCVGVLQSYTRGPTCAADRVLGELCAAPEPTVGISSQVIVLRADLRRSGCVQLHKDWRLEAVANACRNLLSASLEGCKFERPIVHFIIMRNPQLVHVNLSGLSAVTNSTCRMLAQSCPQMESLNVSFCTNTDGRGLRRVVEGCRNLRELRACELHINDAPLMQALFKANTVERLHFGDSVGVTDEHIRLLVEGADPEIDPFTGRNTAPARKLAHLDLRKCTQLTDNALRYLSGNIPHLVTLELGGVVALTDAGLAQLLPTIPKLSHLDLEECLELTNTTLFNIAKSPAAKKLGLLQVSYCENMGDAGMIELLRKCDGLWNLEMDNSMLPLPTMLWELS
jgi:F-box/leucine-rich repeat protein 2/20